MFQKLMDRLKAKFEEIDWLPKIIASVVIVVLFAIYNYITSNARTELGPMGDYFGGILNPVFSFLSLVLLIFTLKQNEKELGNSRKELEASTKALKQQAESMEFQRFESAFFNLLAFHNQLLEKITDSKNNDSSPPKSYLKRAHELAQKKDSGSRQFNSLDLTSGIDVFDFEKDVFNQYFRTLFQLLKFIHSNTQNLANERYYSDIVRASLPGELLPLLAIYAHTNAKFPELRVYPQLIERYALFEYFLAFRKCDLFMLIPKSFDKSAFGFNEAYKEI